MDDLLVRLVAQPRGDAGEVLFVGLDGELPVGDRGGEFEGDLVLELLLEVIAEFHASTIDLPAPLVSQEKPCLRCARSEERRVGRAGRGGWGRKTGKDT